MNIRVIDSHTGGEPTRVVLDGWIIPEAISHDVVAIRNWIDETQANTRTGLLCEPRGSSAWVGALLVPPKAHHAVAGVVFFNTHATLGMCGHGTIGLVETLKHLEMYEEGEAIIETPVGEVSVLGHQDGSVEIKNVPSYRFQADVEISLPDYGKITGDIAWGGNWFFLVKSGGPIVNLANLKQLTAFTEQVKAFLKENGITGAECAEIDHIEVFGAPQVQGANSKNYVLCPSLDYDRSPCGTGTSAKLACLYADGKLAIGQKWIQESITGSTFTGWLEEIDGQLIPHIQGSASIIAESTLHFHEKDEFRWGIV